MFEDVTLIERERKLDGLKKEYQHQGEQCDRQRAFSAANGVAHGTRGARERQGQ